MNYSVSCQYAHHQHDESGDLRVMSAIETLQAFDAFSWSEQVSEANRLQKSAPTFSISAGERLIWVSAYGDPSTPIFISECSFPGVKRILFDFIQKRGTVHLRANEWTLEQSRRAVERFLSGEDDALRALYGNG
jgi:hypothetical protein